MHSHAIRGGPFDVACRGAFAGPIENGDDSCRAASSRRVAARNATPLRTAGLVFSDRGQRQMRLPLTQAHPGTTARCPTTAPCGPAQPARYTPRAQTMASACGTKEMNTARSATAAAAAVIIRGTMRFLPGKRSPPPRMIVVERRPHQFDLYQCLGGGIRYLFGEKWQRIEDYRLRAPRWARGRFVDAARLIFAQPKRKFTMPKYDVTKLNPR
jgi:hypothetical protein